VRDRAQVTKKVVHWLSIATEFKDLGWRWTPT